MRKVYGTKPPIKVIYSLTELGKTFVPILEAVNDWGKQVIVENGEFVDSV